MDGWTDRPLYKVALCFCICLLVFNEWDILLPSCAMLLLPLRLSRLINIPETSAILISQCTNASRQCNDSRVILLIYLSNGFCVSACSVYFVNHCTPYRYSSRMQENPSAATVRRGILSKSWTGCFQSGDIYLLMDPKLNANVGNRLNKDIIVESPMTDAQIILSCR